MQQRTLEIGDLLSSDSTTTVMQADIVRLLLLGATGLVGSHTLKLALANSAISEVIAPTRIPLAPEAKLTNPVDEHLESLAQSVKGWHAGAVVCALGTTRAKAGSQKALRYVDYELPLLFASASHAAGVDTFAVVSAIGASTTSRFFYARTKGALERDLQLIGFRSLTICRPSIIGGQRNEERTGEGIALTLARLLAPILPRKFHENPAPVIARSLLQAVLAATPGCRWIFAEEMN